MAIFLTLFPKKNNNNKENLPGHGGAQLYSGDWMSERPPSSTERVLRQPGLHRELLSGAGWVGAQTCMAS